MTIRQTILFVGAVALVSSGCSGDDAVAAQPPSGIPGAGGFFALSVADLDASERWYVEKLEMAVRFRVPKQNGVAVVVLSSGNLIVELVANDGARALSSTDPAAADRVLLRGPFKVGFLVDDFASAVSRLRANGADIAFGPFPASTTQKANVIVRDNSGNLLQIISR